MSDAEVLFDVRGRAGLITLNRPRALNALTIGMAEAMHAQLSTWAADDAIAHVIIIGAGDKAFCAGGDIRQLYDWGLARDPAFLNFYRTEYLLNTFIKRYPKPYIAIMDGITMGGGVGLSVHGSHRVATEQLTFAMPETGIGLFPDVGGTYFLPRCPGSLGVFFGLTGHRLKAADAIYAGICDRFVPSDRIDALIDRLAEASEVSGTIAALSEDPARSSLTEITDDVDACFAEASIEAILERLAALGGDWADKTRDIMLAKSPTSQKITLEQLTRGVSLDFEDCMKVEYRMVNRIFTGHDFYEGIRAVVIDKDQTPHWQPATLAEVTEDDVMRYFDELTEELPV